MNRQVVQAIIKFLVKSFLVTTAMSATIILFGYFNHWNSSVNYSNAFFVVGCLVIVAGTASRMGAGQGLNSLQYLNMESFRGMSGSERVSFIIDANSPLGLVILGIFVGSLLILISVIISNIV
ncbi:MAG: hypothetical protein ACK2TV_05120 [Anaerolineales bacterium]